MTKSNSLAGNLGWKFAERVATQLITLIVSILLARILSPADYGVVAAVTIFITLANVLVSDGFGNALIQKKDADALDFSSVLWFNFGFSIVLYALLFFAAPLISRFFGESYTVLTPVLRVLGLRLIAAGINSVQQAYVARKMIFRKFFLATIAGAVLSGAVGIAMAYVGCGVWALVAQYLTNTVVSTAVLGLSLRKRPLFALSWKRLEPMMGFGVRLLGTRLLIVGYEELRAVIVGKLYSADSLAYYDKGRQFPNLIVGNLNTSVGTVLFPRMAQEQDAPEKLRQTIRRSVRFTSFLLFPVMLGLAVVAKPLVILLLTEKWLPCVPLLQLFCIVYLFQPMHTANMQAIKALGKGKLYFRLELGKKLVELAVLLSVMRLGVTAIVISAAILTTLYTAVNALPVQKLLGYSFLSQLRDIGAPLLFSLLAVCAALPLSLLPLSPLPLILLQETLGATVYLAAARIARSPELAWLTERLRKLFSKNHR